MNQTRKIILRGNIEKVFYAGPKFSAGRLRDEDGRSRSFAGNLFAVEGQHVALAGHWETHPDYGQQFKVDHVEVEMPGDPEGLARYIANHPEVKGIGPTRAAKIAHAFGEDFEDALLHSPERIAEVAKVPVSVIENLRTVWMTSRRFNAVMTWLSAFGLTHHQAATLIEKLGNNAQAVLEDNPYHILREIKGLGFKKVDQIARKMGTPKEHQPRIRAGILHCVHEAVSQGDCWVECEDLIDRANTQATGKAIVDLAQRVGVCELAEQHANKLRPAGESTRMTFPMVLLDDADEFRPGNLLQKLTKQTGGLYHRDTLLVGVGNRFVRHSILQRPWRVVNPPFSES